MDLPSALRGARDAAGLSQSEVAEALGILVSGYAHWEGGRRVPLASHLPGLAAALGVTLCAGPGGWAFAETPKKQGRKPPKKSLQIS